MLLIVAVFPLALGAGVEDVRDIVRKSVNHDSRNWELARNYTFVERSVEKELDSSGKVKKTDIETHEILILYGQPYSKLVARDDKALPPKEAKKVQEKLDKMVAERERETPEQRARRLADFEKRRERQRKFVREIPDAFEFRLAREEPINGRDTWVIEATPKPGYKPRDAMAARVFPKIRATFWIDKSEYQWVKAESETIDTIAYGGIIARLGKGAQLWFEQVRVNDEVWLPRRLQAKATARVALFKKMAGEVEVTYSGYKKFQSDSHVVSVAEVP